MIARVVLAIVFGFCFGAMTQSALAEGDAPEVQAKADASHEHSGNESHKDDSHAGDFGHDDLSHANAGKSVYAPEELKKDLAIYTFITFLLLLGILWNMSSSDQSFDVAAQQVGNLYAKALLGASEAAGTTPAIVDELDSLVTDVLDVFPKLEAILASEMLSLEDSLSILDRVFAKQASPMLLNFLKVVAEHRRLGALRAIRQAVHEQYDELRGKITVKMITATPADAVLVEPARALIAARTGQVPEFVPEIDPAIIGGVVLQMGDTVFDGSVVAQLERLRGRVVEQSVYNIQNRRSDFVATD